MPTYTNATGTTQVVTASSGAEAVVPNGGSVQTYQILGSGWTKTSDEPYFELATFRETVTSPATVSGLIGQKIIRVVTADDDIFMTANVSENPNTYPLTANIAMDILNGGQIDALVFTGAGTVTVIGLQE